MAQGKKSFIVYSDWEDLFEVLTDTQAANLMRHIFRYVNDRNPELKDKSIAPVWAMIKPRLKEDLKKWEGQRKQRSEAGKKSAEARQRNSTSVNEKERVSTVNVNGNVNVSTNVDVYDQYKTEIKTQVQWCETFYIKHRLKKNTLSPLLDEFITHLKLEEKNHASIKEFKSHFMRWADRLEQVGKLDKYKPGRKVGSL